MTSPREPSAREDVGRSLSVRADLVLDVDGGTVHVRGTGDRLTVDAHDPVALWRQLTSVSLPADGPGRAGRDTVGRAGDLLASVGLTATVSGPDGTLAVLGRDARSTLGRLATGSPHVRFGTRQAVGPTARAIAVDVVRGRPVVLVVALAVAGVAVLAGAASVRAGRRR